MGTGCTKGHNFSSVLTWVLVHVFGISLSSSTYRVYNAHLPLTSSNCTSFICDEVIPYVTTVMGKFHDVGKTLSICDCHVNSDNPGHY